MTTTQISALLPLDAVQEETFQAWRAKALEAEGGMPYMASMLFSLRPINAPGLGTFAVDAAHRLYIDFDAVEPKGVRWCAEALLHECCHLFGEHAARAEDAGVTRDERELSNYASDAEINDDLRDAGCDMSDAVLPESIGCADYDVFEVYLEHLRKKVQKRQQQQQRSGQGQGSGQGQSQGKGNGQGEGGQQPGQGAPSQAQNGQGGGNGQSDGSGQPGQFHGCGSGSGGAPAPCELADGDDGRGQFPGATQAERDQATISTAIAINEEGASGRGTVPAGLRAQAAMKLRPSKVSWQRQLSAAVRRAVGSRAGDFDNTWSRRSRRGSTGCARVGGGRVMRPGTFTPSPSIAVIRDTSGSMGGDDLNEASSEIDAIAKQLGIRGDELQVLDCDAVVHLTRGYRGKATLNDVAGRGGTDMVEGIRVAMELRPKPTAIVVVTDGGTPWPHERLSTPIVACLVGRYAESSSAAVPEWIKTIVVD
jgi:predicted metal-dependent peptidase